MSFKLRLKGSGIGGVAQMWPKALSWKVKSSDRQQCPSLDHAGLSRRGGFALTTGHGFHLLMDISREQMGSYGLHCPISVSV